MREGQEVAGVGTIPARCFTDHADPPAWGTVVVLAVKRPALATLVPQLEGAGLVVGVQNGLGLEAELAALHPTVAAGTFDGEVRIDNGVVVQRSSRVTVTVSSPQAQDWLAAAGIPVSAARSYAATEARRFLLVDVMGTLGAATGLRNGAFKKGRGKEEFDALLYEAARLLAAYGHEVRSMCARAEFILSRIPVAGTFSLAVDVGRGRRGELDYLTGHVVSECRRLGIPAPAHEHYLGLIEQQLTEAYDRVG